MARKPQPVEGITSLHVLKQLREGGPATAEVLAARCGLPMPHVRAVISELVFLNRVATCDAGGVLKAEPPPEGW